MEIPDDFKELLKLLNSNRVDFLIVGAYALGFHGAPRYTGDLDIFIAANPANADAILQSIDDFGFGSLGLEQKDFTEPGNVIQIGYPPIRVDFLTQILVLIGRKLGRSSGNDTHRYSRECRQQRASDQK